MAFPDSTSVTELDDVSFARFQRFIYETAGIHVADHKRTLLSNRIRPRVLATGQESFSSYYRLLTSPAGRRELRRFLDEVTTNETYFFRDPGQFEWFSGPFLRETRERARRTSQQIRPRLRVWSAACSTGAEPYSIALCIAEQRHHLADWDTQIVATDISEAVLLAARQAVFDTRALRNVSSSQKKRFFSKRGAGEDAAWELGGEPRRLVSFRRHNLLEGFGGGPFQCVFVKNVLIYFDDASKRRAVQNLVRTLVHGGYLVTGPAEGIGSLLGELEMIEPWLYRRP